jgi:ribosomal protein S27E
MTNNYKEGEEMSDSLIVKCEHCGYVNNVVELSAWSYLILKRISCNKCGNTIIMGGLNGEKKQDNDSAG